MNLWKLVKSSSWLVDSQVTCNLHTSPTMPMESGFARPCGRRGLSTDKISAIPVRFVAFVRKRGSLDLDNYVVS